MTTTKGMVKIYAPSTISEYEAERLAKSAGDIIGEATIIQVFDNVGLKRAERIAW